LAGYFARRLVGMLAVLLAMIAIVFALQSVIPADPARALAGPSAPEQTVLSVRQSLGLDQPLPVQFALFVNRLMAGDLGTSIRTRQPVAADIARYLPASLELMAMALAIGLPLALVLALAQHRFPRSQGLRLLLLGSASAPIFLTAMLLAIIFWFQLGWLPGGRRIGIETVSGPTGLLTLDGLLSGQPLVTLEALRHLVLPSVALALPIAVAVGRTLGSALRDVMRTPYVQAARGRGASETELLVRHGIRNAATPALAMAGLQVSLLIGNLLIVERVFAWPGLGLYLIQSFGSSDLPAILGASLVFGAVYILVNVLVELMQSLADPRIDLTR
jgi:peptide/nickel transport system permease protein/dipeptide transport system permease protein